MRLLNFALALALLFVIQTAKAQTFGTGYICNSREDIEKVARDPNALTEINAKENKCARLSVYWKGEKEIASFSLPGRRVTIHEATVIGIFMGGVLTLVKPEVQYFFTVRKEQAI